jgi:glyoxylase-like metal-dependent hydrolase (beta-lactamase superfamily II)
MQTTVASFFHQPTSTWSHIASDPASGEAVIIDPVLDYDHAAGRTSTESADELLEHVVREGLAVTRILETHAHADHLTSAPYLKAQLGAPIGIGQGIREVQRTFRPIFDLEPGFATDGSQFDQLFAEGEEFPVGRIKARVIPTPGHTNDSITYVVGDAAFIGDTLFAPDYGTARCDFPGGDAGRLHDSIQRLYQLPGGTRLYLCHDYPPGERAVVASFTVDEQRNGNIHVRHDTPREEFIRMRTARDRTLDMPALILPSVQVNIRAGRLPPAAANGTRYLKIPVDKL